MLKFIPPRNYHSVAQTNLLQLTLESKEYETLRSLLTAPDLKSIPSNLINIAIEQGALTVADDLINAGCKLSINSKLLLDVIKKKDRATILWLLEKNIAFNSIPAWHQVFIDGDISIIDTFLEYGLKLPNYNLTNYQDFMRNYASLYLHGETDFSSDFERKKLLWQAYPLLEICAQALSKANTPMLNYLLKTYPEVLQQIFRDHLPQLFLSQTFEHSLAFNSSIDWLIHQTIPLILPDWQGRTLLERVFIHSCYPLTYYLRLIAEVSKKNPGLKDQLVEKLGGKIIINSIQQYDCSKTIDVLSWMLANTKILLNQVVKIFYHSFTTLLEKACLSGENKLVIALLEAKADPNLSSTPKNSPLHIACKKSPKFARMVSQTLFSSFIMSIAPPNIQLIRILLDAGAKANKELTPLLAKWGVLNTPPVSSSPCESKYSTNETLPHSSKKPIAFKFLFDVLFHGLKTCRSSALKMQNLANSDDLGALVTRRLRKLSSTDDTDPAKEQFKAIIFPLLLEMLENQHNTSMLNLPPSLKENIAFSSLEYRCYRKRRISSLQQKFLQTVQEKENKTDSSFWHSKKEEELFNLKNTLQSALKIYVRDLPSVIPWGGPLELQAISYLFKIKIILLCSGIKEPCMCVGEEYKTVLPVYYSPDEDSYSLQQSISLQERPKISRRYSVFNLSCENDSKEETGSKRKKIRTSQDDIGIGVSSSSCTR